MARGRGREKESEIRKFLRGIMEHRGRRKNGSAESSKEERLGWTRSGEEFPRAVRAAQTRSGGLGVKGPRWLAIRSRVSELFKGEGRVTIEVAAA